MLRFPENATRLLYLQTQASPTRRRSRAARDRARPRLSRALRRVAERVSRGDVVSSAADRALEERRDPRLSARSEAWRTTSSTPPVGRCGTASAPRAASRSAASSASTPRTRSTFGSRRSCRRSSPQSACSFRSRPIPTRIWFSPDGLLRNGKATIVGESWVGGSDPEQSLNLRCVQAVKGGDNHSFYCSKRFEALFDDQARTPRA